MKIAALNMDAQDKTRFEIQGKSSVKYHLKANHVVEAKRWFWTLNNASGLKMKPKRKRSVRTRTLRLFVKPSSINLKVDRLRVLSTLKVLLRTRRLDRDWLLLR